MSVTGLINSHGVSVDIQRPTSATDNAGGWNPNYSDQATETMCMQPKGGTKSVQMGGDRNTKTVYFYAASDTATTAGDRLSYSGRYFDVTAIVLPGEAQVSTIKYARIETVETEGVL